MKILAAFIFSLSLASTAVLGQEIQSIKFASPTAEWLPDSAITQHAAYAGYLAVGFGYEWRDSWALDLLYGYTPVELAGQAVHSWTLKPTAYLGSIGSKQTIKVQPYLGLSIHYSPDDELFVRLPSQYPKGYYTATAFRPALVGGLEFRIRNSVAVGFEFAVLDSELAYWRDSQSFDASEMGSGGLSVRWLL